MAEIKLEQRPPLALAATRFGKAGGDPGLSVRLRSDFTIASMAGRRMASPALAERMNARFGLLLPDGPRHVQKDGLSVLGTGPGRWLFLHQSGAASFARELAEDLAEVASVCDQSHGYALFQLSGPACRAALAKGVPIDLHPERFGPDDCAVTSAAHISVILWQHGASFMLAVFRSYAGSFWHWLEMSGAEFGIALESEKGTIP